MNDPEQAAVCLHRRVQTFDPRDGLVAEEQRCQDCGATLAIRLLHALTKEGEAAKKKIPHP